MRTIYAFSPDHRAWKLRVTPEWAQRHDNGRLVSCGLTVGEDISQRVLDGLLRRGQASEVDIEIANHIGCQSSCKLRGSERCSW